MKNIIYFDPDFNFVLLECQENEDNSIYINMHTSAAANQALNISVDGGAVQQESLSSDSDIDFLLDTHYWASNADTTIFLSNSDGSSALITISFPEVVETSAALNYDAENGVFVLQGSENTGSGGGGGGGAESFDFIETIRNIGFRLLDEPANVILTYDEGLNQVALRWTDPADIVTNEPVPATWAGTVVVRRLNHAPRHKWDGVLIGDSTTRNAHELSALIDSTLEVGKKYYYGIFPYDTNGHYRYTRTLAIGESEQTVFTFEYTGNVQTFNAPKSGIYFIEAWGASGWFNEEVMANFAKHSLGGYSCGYIELDQADALFIGVGGKGGAAGENYHTAPGGWNGGGSGGPGLYSNYAGGGGGGGASHVALSNHGELYNYSIYRDDIVLVAGGGGGTTGYDWGAENYTEGVNCGGGFEGREGFSQASPTISGGTQSTGYEFGRGQNGGSGQQGSGSGEGRGGGGGGWYGGFARTGSSYSNYTNAGGAGGSGYINTNVLTDAHMAGYNVAESSATATKTQKTLQYSTNPESDKAKIGNGVVRITFYRSN